MKSNRVFHSILALTLACMLFSSGCGKHTEQPNENAPGNAPQPASTPAPPPDQPGASSPAPSAAPAPSQNGAPAATPAPNGPGETAQAAPPQPLVIPAGTHIAVTTQRDLGSKISQAGETFTATVASPIMIDGQYAIRAGARASGTVVDAKPLGRFKGGAYLELRLDTIRADGNTYQVRSNALERVEKSKGRRSAKFIGGGAGLGAIIGGVAGGGKGALIGGLVGGGAGTAGAGLTGKRDIFIPAETTLTFRLRSAVQISR
ncbi:MAG TPA: hypothetical protein VFW25_09565 [Silvibacterium sp.]|nr:hypothetical protein [Silvibacterium sp.]